MAKSITIDLTDEQERALAERGVDIESYAKREIDRVHVEALKFRSNALAEAIVQSGDAALIADAVLKLDTAATDIALAIEAKNPKVEVVDASPVEEIQP